MKPGDERDTVVVIREAVEGREKVLEADTPETLQKTCAWESIDDAESNQIEAGDQCECMCMSVM